MAVATLNAAVGFDLPHRRLRLDRQPRELRRRPGGARRRLAAWIFIPEDLELAKVVGTAVYGPHTRARARDLRRREPALPAPRSPIASAWGLVNLNLRSYYGEGSKTMAFEIAEQLGWRLPDAVIAPMAGGSLVTKLDKGFRELADASLVAGPLPRMYRAQASGCSPIVNLVERGGETIEPVIPRVGALDRDREPGRQPVRRARHPLLRRRGGGRERRGPRRRDRLLAETTGVFTETAGGVTVAAALRLAREESCVRPTSSSSASRATASRPSTRSSRRCRTRRSSQPSSARSRRS